MQTSSIPEVLRVEGMASTGNATSLQSSSWFGGADGNGHPVDNQQGLSVEYILSDGDEVGARGVVLLVCVIPVLHYLIILSICSVRVQSSFGASSCKKWPIEYEPECCDHKALAAKMILMSYFSSFIPLGFLWNRPPPTVMFQLIFPIFFPYIFWLAVNFMFSFFFLQFCPSVCSSSVLPC